MVIPQHVHENISIRKPPLPVKFQAEPDEATDTVMPSDLQLEMVFDKTTHYIAIPSDKLQMCMRELPHESFLGK